MTFTFKMPKNNIVYSQISKFVDSPNRIELVQKYESGKLSPKDLLGDSVFFEGIHEEGIYLWICFGS